MRALKQVTTLLLFAVLTLSACTVPQGLLARAQSGAKPTASTAAAAPSAATAAPTSAAATPADPTSAPASATAAPTPLADTTPTSQSATIADDVKKAVQTVVERANTEQQQAFAQHDATVMRDTATTGYYDELVQTNQDLADSGVTSIKLVKLEWGSLSPQAAGNVEATTFETWRTSYSDGTTDEQRDRNVYTLVQAQGAWKIQSDAHPDDQLAQPPGVAPAGVVPPGSSSRSPQPSATVVPARAGQSHNWSGYAATGGNYTAVSATWTVPQTTAQGTFGSDATWVGIGGVRNRDLIQAGTEATTLSSGQTRYNAWIEMLPRASHPVPLTVNPGDSVTVSIAQQTGNDWLISLKDNTSSKDYQTTVTYQSSLTSADWVEEAPSGGRRVMPLDDFGTVQFSNATATKDGKSVNLSQAGARAISMIDRTGQVIAKPSVLGSDGGSFSVAYVPQSTAPATSPAPNIVPGGDPGGIRVQPGIPFEGAQGAA